MADDLEKPPTRTRADIASTLVKAGFDLVPVVGGTAAELFGLVIAPTLEKRRDQWLEQLAVRLKKLEQQNPGVKIEDLGKNEVFVSAVLHASQIALRTHEEEKLESLRNALLQIAVKPLKEDLQIFFLSLVDVFTITHIEILRLFDKPSTHSTRRAELTDRRIITDPFVMDLSSRGLVRDTRPSVTRNRDSEFALVSYEWQLSDLGRDFLTFISNPYEA